MRYAASYLDCTPPDDSLWWESLTIAVAGYMHDGDTADDVKIDAARIAYLVNKEARRCCSPSDVVAVAEDAEHYARVGELP